jgi:SH3 domain-containing protein
MPIEYNEDEARRGEQDLERDMKIFSDLKSIRLPDGTQVKILAMSREVESHIRKFHLKKATSFQRSDPRVVEAARRLAIKRDNTLLVVRTDDGFDLYDMKEESQIQARERPATYSGYVPTEGQDRGCLIAIGIVVVIVIVLVIAIMSGKGVNSTQQPAQQGQTVGTMREVRAVQLNMRSGPGKHYSVVRVFKQNERIVTIGEPQNVNGELWIQASTPDGQTRGWITRKFLSP